MAVAINTTMEYANSGVVHAEAFGASPAASGATNYAAIQAAINAAAGNIGAVVELGPGRFALSQSLVGAAYSGNEGYLRLLNIRGAGNATVPDIFGAYNSGTTLYIESAADTPVFNLAGTRGATIKDINILGDDSSVVDSCGIWFRTANQAPVLDRVTIGGFSEGIRIGTSGVTGANDDFGRLSNCLFTDVKSCIRNYSSSSYGWVLSDSTVFSNCESAFVTSNYGYVVMNSIRIRNCSLAGTGPIIKFVLSSIAAAYDIAVIESCVIEGAEAAPAILFTQNMGYGGHANGLVIRNNVINSGNLASLYADGGELIKYYGGGPFVFENNNVTVPRSVFFLDCSSGSGAINDGALSLSRNVFISRPAILYPLDATYPPLSESGNVWYNETPQALANSQHPCQASGEMQVKFAGRVMAGDFAPGHSAFAGSQWSLSSRDSNLTDDRHTIFCVIAGTGGTVSGVTATLVSGNNYATFTAGTEAEKAKVAAGRWITIGASGPLLVYDVLGDIIYLRATYAGATQTAQALDYSPPVFHSEFYAVTGAPSGTWVGGDVAWRTAVGAGESPGWIYTNAGWKAMAIVAA